MVDASHPKRIIKLGTDGNSVEGTMKVMRIVGCSGGPLFKGKAGLRA